MRYILFAIIIFFAATGLYYLISNYKSNDPNEFEVPNENVFLFKGVEGPDGTSVVSDPVPFRWSDFRSDDPGALTILLTDTASDYIGLVHGLKNIGVSVRITRTVSDAIASKVLLVYPIISGLVLSQEDLQALAAVPRNGGTLIGFNVSGGGLNEVFGFENIVAGKNRTLLRFANEVPGITDVLGMGVERNIRLTNPTDFKEVLPCNGYTGASTPVITYSEDGTALLVYKDYGVGRSFAFGLDLGTYFLRYMNERGFNAFRNYANHYESGIDAMLRLLRQMYLLGNKEGVTLGTVPFGKEFTLLLTHDIDFTRSIVNAVKYAELEKSMGTKGTYFIQTKYIKDWNDDIFFNDQNLKYLEVLKSMGMEIGSHSVSHSRVYSKAPLGTGKEQYPEYKPFVKAKLELVNGTVLGELRVSKFLLEHFAKGITVESFRPGHLQYPFSLPQALKATGFRYSSAVTANNVQTYFPYMAMYNRGFEAETDIVEIPIAIEDEIGLPMLQRLDSALMLAKTVAKYGGVVNVLIHTDTLGGKIEFERRLLQELLPISWSGSVKEFGSWWRVRNSLVYSVKTKPGGATLYVRNPGPEAMQGTCFNIPGKWKYTGQAGGMRQEGGRFIIDQLQGKQELQLNFAF